MKKLLISYIFVITCYIPSFSQGIKDTIIIDAVNVYSKQEYFTDGAKREILDTNLLKQSPGSTLSEVLLQGTPLIIKSYGNAGAASSVSLRGGGSSRTQITWEGFPINSITMGENDLSMIPASNFNTISIDHSAAGTNFGSGTFGGVIELKNSPDWKKNMDINLSFSEASFGTKKLGTHVVLGNDKIQYNSSIYYAESKGNFKYKDYTTKNNDIVERKNADYYGYGTIQNIHIKISEKLIAQAGVWYQCKNLNLPGIIGSNNNYVENQIDSSFKAFISLKKLFQKSFLLYKSSYMHDFQFYTKESTNKFLSNFSKSTIESKRNLHSLRYVKFLTPKITGNVELQGNINSAHLTNYKDIKTEYSSAGIISLQYKNNVFQTNASIRKEINSQYKIPIILSSGIQCNILKKRMTLRANIGNKYRTPTFNDLYWEVWGNPDLIPEFGISYELGNQFTIIENKTCKLIGDISAYNSVIHNMILWTQQGSVWHPINMAEATLQGIEFRIKHVQTFRKITIKNNIGIDYNNSHISEIYSNSNNEAAIKHQLYYVPKFSINFNPELTYKTWSFGAYSNYQSSRYFSLNKKLEAYFTFDLFIKYAYTTKKITSYFTFQGKNITNTSYELIRSYPMPGRYFEFSIQFLINN